MDEGKSEGNPTITRPKKRSNGGNDKKRKTAAQFEYCKVCKLNHDQGHRHKYFPRHTQSLSSFLSRFQSKLSEVCFFLINPTLLRPEHASRNRFWCVFCDLDIDELGSSLVCSNAIKHLASLDHAENLRHFRWKYGGGMDLIDKYRISEDDVVKWNKKCMLLKTEAALSNEASRGPLIGPSNDIHHELNYGNINSYDNNNAHSVKSNGVMPLLYHTNEYQVSHSGFSEVTDAGLSRVDITSSLPMETYSYASYISLNDSAVDWAGQHSLNHSNLKHSTGVCCSNDVCQDERIAKGESSFHGLQLTLISSMAPEEPGGNVHSGARPPWLEAVDESQLDVKLKPVFGGFLSSSSKSGKSNKLNPKRVGAAWAEKRKMEMEMEKRGEFVKNEFDADWLPNFGRVWQSGTRKESRKEFESEKQKLSKNESQPEMPIKIQPYVSKRMRRDVEE